MIKHTYYIVNTKTSRYIEDPDPTFEGEWKDQYPHTKDADWSSVWVAKIWEDQMAGPGIPYVYSLCQDGGLYTLIVDRDKFSKEDVEAAKLQIRRDFDVVRLMVLNLKTAKIGS